MHNCFYKLRNRFYLKVRVARFRAPPFQPPRWFNVSGRSLTSDIVLLFSPLSPSRSQGNDVTAL
jgi:hypothetical protein